MVAGIYDIVCEQGATFRRELTWTDENEAPIDLYGYSARMHVRPTVASATILATLTTTNGGISLNSETGKITLLLTATQTNDLAAFRGVYDLEMVAPNGYVTRLLEGKFTVSPQVTR